MAKILLSLEYPLTFLSAKWLRYAKSNSNTEISDKIYMKLGVFPILDHYYQPLINPKKHLNKSLRDDRVLKGIDFNINEQLDLLQQFKYNEELTSIPLEKPNEIKYYYNNGSFCSGDAEYLYNIVRHFKPRKIIEIGSGFSTLMVRNAIQKNNNDLNYSCNHICIEPYEQSWLENISIDLIRQKVENISLSFFEQLEKNDILFIDSSHIIRPQGDVLFEILEILPRLKSGVLIHIHDIFTPKDYLDEWIFKHYLWNEQYLIEAFMSFNNEFKIIGALNYLKHNYKNELENKCPILKKQEGREPGSFWLQRQ